MWNLFAKKNFEKEDTNKIYVSENICSVLNEIQRLDDIKKKEAKKKEERDALEFSVNFPVPEVFKQCVYPRDGSTCYLRINGIDQQIIMFYDGTSKIKYMVVYSGKYYKYETFTNLESALLYITKGKTIVCDLCKDFKK